jgi:hypothetical protein
MSTNYSHKNGTFVSHVADQFFLYVTNLRKRQHFVIYSKIFCPDFCKNFSLAYLFCKQFCENENLFLQKFSHK